jgi:Zn-dependent protease with chaperone function
LAESVMEQASCPECGAVVPFAAGFVTWCQGCEWNVDPSPDTKKLKWRERQAAEASARASRRLFERLSATGMTGPPPRSAAINLVALLVHLLTVLTFAVGLSLLADGFGLPLAVRLFFGALAVGAAAVVQPFWRRQKIKRKPLTRVQAPAFFGLVDEVAAALGCKGLDGILVSPDFNASIGRTREQGWVMTIGWPLWSTLSPQERVALVGHELGHQLNNDQRTLGLVHFAAVTMGRWAYLLNPYSRITPTRGLAAIAEPIAILCMLPLTMSAAALQWLLTVLAGRQGLAAEYYADALAAKAGGTDAAVSGLEKLLLALACHRHLHHTLKFNKSVDPWQEVAAYAAAIPPQEMERQRRLGRLRLPAIDSSHPPTQLRADLIRKRPHREPLVVLGADRAAAIDANLAGAVAATTKRVRTWYPR